MPKPKNRPFAESGDTVAAEVGGASPDQLEKLASAAALLPTSVDNKDSEDTQAQKEEKFFSKEKKAAELESYRQDMTQRKYFAVGIFGLIVIWLAAIFALLLLHGFMNEGTTFEIEPSGVHFMLTPKFKLSDSVLLALIGGTTVNVLGLLILVVKYLFPRRDSN